MITTNGVSSPGARLWRRDGSVPGHDELALRAVNRHGRIQSDYGRGCGVPDDAPDDERVGVTVVLERDQLERRGGV